MEHLIAWLDKDDDRWFCMDCRGHYENSTGIELEEVIGTNHETTCSECKDKIRTTDNLGEVCIYLAGRTEPLTESDDFVMFCWCFMDQMWAYDRDWVALAVIQVLYNRGYDFVTTSKNGLVCRKKRGGSST